MTEYIEGIFRYLAIILTELQDSNRRLQLRELQNMNNLEVSRKNQQREQKQRHQKNLKPLMPTAMANRKHSLASYQENKTHTKGLFTSVPITQYIMSSF